jgi:hypothetical protein
VEVTLKKKKLTLHEFKPESYRKTQKTKPKTKKTLQRRGALLKTAWRGLPFPAGFEHNSHDKKQCHAPCSSSNLPACFTFSWGCSD